MMTEAKVAAAIAQSNAKEEASRAMLAALKLVNNRALKTVRICDLAEIQSAIAVAGAAGITEKE